MIKVIVFAVALTSCSAGPQVYTDPETGCEYLVMSAREMTPRVDADGNHICTRGARE